MRPSFYAYALTDFPDKAAMEKGRIYSSQIEDGVIEAVATDAAFKKLNLLLDHEYEIYSYKQKQNEAMLFKLKIVGLYKAADNQDLYWYQHINTYSNAVMIDPAVMQQLSDEHQVLNIGEQQLVAGFDYHRFRIQDIEKLQDISVYGLETADANSRTTRFYSSFAAVVERYILREAELKLTMQILIIPILLMLLFYIFMVSQLMVRSETGLISVLESRGAGRKQILLIYFLESLIYGVITLVIGPLLGLWMVKVIGASNGFLEFVNRKSLKVEIDRQALIYGGIAVLVFLITTLMPVFIQARTSIVEQKRQKSRKARPPIWQRIFLDLVLLAIGIYALTRLMAQVRIQRATGVVATQMQLDFLLFLASTIFILGAGLLFLRIYPFLIRFIYFLGRRIWNPVLYASFHQISRSNGQEQFLMIFLILALSIGLFNANAARTINRNTEDSIRCLVGSDLMLQEYWQKYDQDGNPLMEDTGGAMSLDQSADSGRQIIKYHEPSLEKFRRLDGVESVARVFRIDNSRVSKGSTRTDRSGTVNLMAIDPYDFAKTAWNRTDLFRYHINEYMNVMMSTPNAVILSRNLQEELGAKVGDGIVYTVNTSDSVNGVIIAFVDYWPGFEPYQKDGAGSFKHQSLLVCNMEYMLSKTAVQPYEVWLKRELGATDKEIYDSISDSGINVTRIISATQDITTAKNDPQLQGTNGALTLGFIVSMLICAVGFLIYWIMSVQGRVLQFGIFRAMGLSKGSVIGMILTEQVLVSGIAVLSGVLIGTLASRLYVPLFQLVYSSADQPIPFRIVAETADSNKILLILGILLLFCFAVLARIILSIKIDQAVKLGED